MSNNSPDDSSLDPQNIKTSGKKKARKRLVLGIVAGIIIIIGIAAYPGLRSIYILYKHGILTSNYEMQKYEGSRSARLKQLYVGLMNYQDSNGQFPNASGWMDGVKAFVQDHNMTTEQSWQKFHDPTIVNSNQYGFSFNKALSDKYVGDIKDPANTIIIFTSEDTKYDAYGDPKTDTAKPPRGGENLGITVKGKIVKLK